VRLLVKNRKATHNYEILEKYIAGIQLLGSEVKSILNGNVSLAEGFVTLKEGEVFLTQVHIDRYGNIDTFNVNINETRDRKLLLNRTEINKIQKKITEKGLTVIPIAIIYSDTRKIKVEIAVCRGKKLYDKRQDLKAKQTDRDAKRENKYG
jgi:SsrA-binding protein